MLSLKEYLIAGGLLLWMNLPIRLAEADVIEVNSAEAFRSAMASAVDGDEILLAPGTYAGGFFGPSLTGVTIRSADPSNPAVIDAAAIGEGIKLSAADRVTISDIIIENAGENGINIDDGHFVTLSTNITLRNITVRNGGGHGIKLTGVDGFDISHSTITDWGDGFAAFNLLGAHNGNIQDTLIQRTNTSGGFGIKVEAGSTNVVIRANRFVDAGERAIQFGGSVSPDTFRPQPPGEVAADDIVAEGNVVVGRGAEIGGIQSAVAYVNIDDAVFRNNLVFRPTVFVGRILKENNNSGFIDTQNGTFADNLIIWNNNDILGAPFNVGVNTLPQTFSFNGNTWFNATNPPNSFINLPSPDPSGVYGVDPGVGPNDVVPWEFNWGTWLVNANDLAQTVPVDPSALLATPNEGAEFDIDLPYPLVGDWTLAPLDSANLQLQPFSQAVLILSASILGDYNSDQVISAADYTLWRDTLGSTTDLSADGNGNRVIDAEDYTIWKSAFTQTSVTIPHDFTVVPEPSSAAFWSLGIMSFFLCRTGSRTRAVKRYREELPTPFVACDKGQNHRVDYNQR